MKKNKKEPFGLGLFIKKDINGNDIRVGDTVKVTRPEMYFTSENEKIFALQEKSWTGVVRLTLLRGVLISSNGRYIKAPITDKSYNLWTWELV